MISNAQQKYVLSLHQKKYRKLNRTFIVEGRKNILELLNSDFKVQQLYCTSIFAEELKNAPAESLITILNEKELNKISTLKTSDQVLAVVHQNEQPFVGLKTDETALILDDINDPGNLGTIIRIADWYGIKHVICSENTVEFYNPKVIMATMGSFTRVKVQVTDISLFLKEHAEQEVLGAYLEGESIYDLTEFRSGFLVLGSESHGISEKVTPFVSKKVTIPRVGGAESLNVAISTAILLDNLQKLK